MLKNQIKKVYDIEKTCCFTGHRVQKIDWKFKESEKEYKHLKKETTKAVKQAIKKGYTKFISGMALGFDTLCAQVVLELKKKFANIELICALPCLTQDKFWDNEQQEIYKNILKEANYIRCIYEEYNSKCMFERNEFMVNNSSLVIAYFNGKAGGTRRTLDYAKTKGKDIIIIK